MQGALEGFHTWLEPDFLLVNGSLLAVAASLILVDRLRRRRLRRAAPHPLWVGAAHPVTAANPVDPDPA
ncbi:hypothetical protein ASALC70_02607 [Alcanivorax sp. ALC70]|nr:hypothetical protein ASALC70_02607 [Alcanivorax sp. ALC70]